MRARGVLLVATLALAARPGAAQDFEFEVTENGLNRLIAQLGDPSSGGVHQSNPLGGLGYDDCAAVGLLDCSGDTAQAATTSRPPSARGRVALHRCVGPDGQTAIVPGPESITWQWWITEARFAIADQQLSFSATVQYRVGDDWSSEQRTVPASLSFDAGSQRLRLDVSPFKVPIRYSANGVSEAITEVDVGRHLSFAIPINAQTVRVPGLDGGLRTLNGRAHSATVDYLAGKIRVRVDARVN